LLGANAGAETAAKPVAESKIAIRPLDNNGTECYHCL
jgi:hypothetical protein